MSKQLQYELWRECNCKCTFCTLGEDNLFTPKHLKLQSINTAIEEIKNFKKAEHDVLGFIGGEFFQGQLNDKEVYDTFMKMIKLSNQALNESIINTLWINASMLIGDQQHLFDCLELIDKKSSVWVLTSYDCIGRFHTKKMFETWENSIFKLHKEYPEINLNITSILTGELIERYLNDEYTLEQFRTRYKASLFFKNPVKPTSLMDKTCVEINEILGNFFPKRKDFLKFLRKFLEKENVLEYDKLISTDLRADEVRKNYNDDIKRNCKFTRNVLTLHEEQEGEELEDLSCGHNDIYASYCDSNACMLCDKKMIKDLYGVI